MLIRFFAVAVALLTILPAVATPATRTAYSLDDNWTLYPMPDFKLWPAQAQLTADQIKQLKIPAPGGGWRAVHLPDDYVVRGEITREPNASLFAGGAVCPLGARECGLPGSEPNTGKPGALNRPGRDAYAGHGYLPVYPAWYRRTFRLPANAKDDDIWIDFGGVYRDAVVFVNGQFVEQHASGYTGFRLNITSKVNAAGENVIAVYVDPRWFEGWWYEGGGIYRHVSLITTDKLQVAPWGSFVETALSGQKANLTIHTTVRNDYDATREFTLVSQVRDPGGKTVATASSAGHLDAGQEATFSQPAELAQALLWSMDQPNLYIVRTAVLVDGKDIDAEQTTFGVRTLRYDPDHGFFLNGRRVEIQGVCSHHDFPAVGIGAPDNLWAWRIAKVKAMGANAWRCAHNPASEAFYEAADRMGILVMDENRHLGDTYFPKAVDTTTFSDLSDVRAMVLQHRNHPSIIMWSLCNEEGQGPKPYGARMFTAMKDAVKKIDPTRPVTGGINGGYTKEGYITVEDILGMNYHNPEFAKIHAQFPKLMIFGSEDTNAKTSRGTLETSREAGLCSLYGEGASPDKPGGQPSASWVPVIENPFVAGQFIWTSFDYRGEPNPFSWPAVTSQTGVMDLSGFPKPVYYYWKAAWGGKPSVYAFPDWNLPKSAAGKDVVVRSFSNCERVDLLLNGKSQGAQAMPRGGHVDWHVPYAPGTLTAVGYYGGREVARYETQTAGPPGALRLVAEMDHIAADGEEVAPIRVEILDKAGRIVSDADPLVRFTVSGAGTIAGVANGKPTNHESNTGSQCHTFRGLAMVLVRAGQTPGMITVRAQSEGLADARIEILTMPSAERPRL